MRKFYRSNRNRYHKYLICHGEHPWNSRSTSRHYQRLLFVTRHPKSHALYTFARISFPNKEPLCGKTISFKLVPYVALSYGQTYYALMSKKAVAVSGTVLTRKRRDNNDSLVDLAIRVTHDIPSHQLSFSLPDSLKDHEEAILHTDFIFPKFDSVMIIVYQPTKSGRRPAKFQGYVAGYCANAGNNFKIEYMPVPPQLINHPSL